MKKILTGFSLLLIAAILLHACAPSVVTVKPSPGVIIRPPAPSNAHVWAGGNYVWRGGRYVWVDGYWAKPRGGRHWVEGHWQMKRGGYVWVPGRWR